MSKLQEMLGDSYKEGMTFDDVANFFEGKNYADLSTGNYVDKGKFDNQVNSLTNQLNATKKQLNDKLTDDEKKAQLEQTQQARIEELEGMLKNTTLASNKSLANNTLTSVRDTLEIKPTDKDYLEFADNIVTEDGEKTNSIASYVSSLVTKAYEKGKKDALKDSLGKFGNSKNDSTGDANKEEIGALGKKLAQASAGKKVEYDYFK